MRGPVNRLLASTARRVPRVCFVLLASLGSSAEANAAGLDSRWIPSFAVIGGLTWGNEHASVASECRAPGSDPPAATSCDPAEPGFGSQLRPGDADDDLGVTPYVGGSFELMTPALTAIGRPRLFASVELPYHFGIDRNVAQKQRPTGVREPEGPNIEELLDENALLGVGSRTRSEVQGLVFGAGAGVSLAFEAWGRQFRLKPSAGWIRYEIDVRGRVEAGICNNDNRFQPDVDTCDLDGKNLGQTRGFTRAITLIGGDSRWFDGIGPGLELEMDTGRVGPFGVSLFLGGRGYYLLGDRAIAFSDTRTIGPDALGGPVEYHADFSFRVSPWLYRAGLGVRFSWLGDSD
jgi:hypothetical protein